MRSVSIVIIILVFALAASSLVACSGDGAKRGETEQVTETASGGADGSAEPANTTDLVSVVYSCAGDGALAETFSYYIHDDGDKVILDAYYIDDEKNSHDVECELTSEDMSALCAIFDKYGYDELIGQREISGIDDEDEGVTYSFTAKYKDGRSFVVRSAGDGAAELTAYFERLAGKN